MTENVSRDYFFRVHSYATGGSTPNDKSPSVGHFGIELVTPDGQSLNLGLYPRTKDDPQSTHSGIIRDDGKVKAEFSNLESSKKITLTPEQGEKMRAFLINAMESPGDYSLLGRNCEEFVQEALKASDIKARTEDFMTDKQRSHFNLAKLTMVNPDEDPKLRHAQDALRADKERYNPDSTDIAPEQTEQKQAAPDTGREAEPDQRSDAGDAQQQQFAEANADTGIETGIDTGGGNNGRNYAAELAALPLGRELSQAWLLQKDPSLWSEQELEDAQASNAYWNSRNPRHDEMQGAVSDVYRYLYGEGSLNFRPDGSLPRAEPINTLRGNTPVQGAQTHYMPYKPGQPEDEFQWRTLEMRDEYRDKTARSYTPFADASQQAQSRETQRQAGLADLGALMEDIPPFGESEQARAAPARYLQQALNAMLWPGKAAPNATGPNTSAIQGKPYRNGPILVDGEIGPVTAQALDKVEAMPGGLPELTRSLKRQAAQDLVQRIDPALPPEDLAGQLNDAVNVFRDLYRPHAGSVRQLQQGLNRLGRESMGLKEGWQPIAEDGDLGPQTAGGFAALAKRLPADSMASLFDFGTEPFRGQFRASPAPDRTLGRTLGRAPSQMPALSARDPNPRQRLRAGML